MGFAFPCISLTKLTDELPCSIEPPLILRATRLSGAVVRIDKTVVADVFASRFSGVEVEIIIAGRLRRMVVEFVVCLLKVVTEPRTAVGECVTGTFTTVPFRRFVVSRHGSTSFLVVMGNWLET